MILYSPVISLPAFSPLEISMQDSFLLKSPLTLSKVKKSNNHLLSRQILMSIISDFRIDMVSALAGEARARGGFAINLSRKIINVLLDGLVCSIVGYFYSSRKSVPRCYTLIRPIRYLLNNCYRGSTFFHRGTIKSFTSQ